MNMLESDDELVQLRNELTALEDELTQRVQNLEQRICLLEDQQLVDATDTAITQAATTPEPNSQSTTTPNDSSLFANGSDVLVETPPAQTPIAQKVNAPITKPIVVRSLFSVIAPFLGPLAILIQQFIDTYQHYKQSGKAPVFFMTVAGIIALVLSFGYLLQYSFSEFLGPNGKVLIGFTLAIAVTVGGALFTKRNPSMGEYGSSIIALGVVLNYLCAYFAGPYFNILPDLIGFGLLIAISGAAYFLALFFETRVVAIITLVGGATMPLVMQHVDHSPVLYLSYLLVLAAAMLRLSSQIRWPELSFITMGLSAVMIEYSIQNGFIGSSTPYGLIIVVHAFFYLFAYCNFQGLSGESTFSKLRIVAACSNLIFFLYLLYQLLLSSTVLGSFYFANALAWAALFLLPNKLFRYNPGSQEMQTVQAISLLSAGVLVAVGILTLCSPEMMGLIWCIEGLLLIYLGAKYQFSSVRAEGYIALCIAMLSMLWHVILWCFNSSVPAPDLLALSVESGWGNLLAITGSLYFAVRLLDNNKQLIDNAELRLCAMVDKLLSVFLSLSFLFSVAILEPQLMWILAIVPMFYLIWRGQQRQCLFTEYLGLGHYLLIFVPLGLSANVIGNFHFSEQTIWGQIARIESFACLWLIAEFYQRYCKQSNSLAWPENLRKLFYVVIPLVFLPKALRQYDEYLPVALWLSSALALVLYSLLRYSVLKLELRLLTVVASVASLYSCWLVEFSSWQGYASAALLAGVVFYLLLAWLGQALLRKPLDSTDGSSQPSSQSSVLRQMWHSAFKPLSSIGFYYWGASIIILSYALSRNLGLALLLGQLYFTVLFCLRPSLAPLRSSLRLCYRLVYFFLVAITVGHIIELISSSTDAHWWAVFNVIAVICAALLVYQDTAQSRAAWGRRGRLRFNLWCFHLVSMAAYITLLAQVFTTMLGPAVSFALVVHATLLLFQSLKPRLKTLITLSLLIYGVSALKILLWDMKDFSIIQKVVVFMLVGLCMLAAAFKYQKMLPQLNVEGATHS